MGSEQQIKDKIAKSDVLIYLNIPHILTRIVEKEILDVKKKNIESIFLSVDDIVI